MIQRIINRAVNWASPWVLGQHPYNTIFAFNYFNVGHIRRFIARKAAELPGDTLVILDVGGGQSPYHPFFAPRCARYIVVDVPDCLPKEPKAGIELMPGTAEKIPLPDASVDVVLCNQVLEHVTDPKASMREIHRVLNPNGVFLGSVPHVSPVHLEPYDFRRYTDLGLQQLLSRHGFTCTEIDPSGGVFSAAALLVTTDWMLSRRKPGASQKFSLARSLFLSPLVGGINLMALMLDWLIPNSGRSAANLCWSAVKPP